MGRYLSTSWVTDQCKDTSPYCDSLMLVMPISWRWLYIKDGLPGIPFNQVVRYTNVVFKHVYVEQFIKLKLFLDGFQKHAIFQLMHWREIALVFFICRVSWPCSRFGEESCKQTFNYQCYYNHDMDGVGPFMLLIYLCSYLKHYAYNMIQTSLNTTFPFPCNIIFK